MTAPLSSEIGSDPLWREAQLTIDIYHNMGHSLEDIEQIIRWEGVILRKLKDAHGPVLPAAPRNVHPDRNWPAISGRPAAPAGAVSLSDEEERHNPDYEGMIKCPEGENLWVNPETVCPAQKCRHKCKAWRLNP